MEGAAVRRMRAGAPQVPSWGAEVPDGLGEEEEKKRLRPPPRSSSLPSRGGGSGLRESRLLPPMLLYLLAHWLLVLLSLRQLMLLPSPGHFSAPRAREYLEHITGLGPRPVGSPANEILTVNYLLGQIKAIERDCSEVHTISVDVQRPTGTFSLDFLGGFTSYYDNITNIAVKLEPRHGAAHAVLANCHFDSVANTPGASDDAVSCAVMLEVLHGLSRSSDQLKHAVVFLFNGAEENVLQASHGFITQHPWAKLVRAFINLEAAGVGGKELVFQTGPENPWLVQAYAAAAVHPFASVVAQEVFQSGVIPSDTDFRIYRDFGNIPGIDLAFIENGYIYHTKYDTPDRILTESIQRAGDNIFSVLKYLATSDQLAHSSEYRHGNIVFFDVCGLFVMVYPAREGAVINSIVAAAAVLYLGRKFFKPRNGGVGRMKDLVYGTGIMLISWFSALVTVLILAVVVSLAGQSLSWYTHFYVSFLLYGSAALAKLIFVHALAKKYYFVTSSEQYLGELFFDVSLMSWCLILSLFIYNGLCSAYIFALWVAFPMLTKLWSRREFTEKGPTLKFAIMYVLGLFIPYLHSMYHVWAVFEMFTPILGRSGTEIPPDAVLASLIAACTIFLTSYFINFIYLANSTKKSILALASVSAIMLLLVCSGIFFPYSSDPANPKPKRIFLQHTTRTFHGLDGNVVKKDSGIWINGFDYTGISHITPHMPEITDDIRAPCDDAPFCGFPWFLPVHFLIRKNWYLPAPEVPVAKRTEFLMRSKETMPWGSTRLKFEITGPSHMTLYVRTHNGSSLSTWSLGDGVPVAGPGGDYFVFYSHGLQAPSWHFWIEVKSSGEQPGGVVTVAVASHYFFGEDQKTPELEELKPRFPKWCFPSGWVCTYDLFVF
ncbi:endoplasmic reticulum metallopeptidase 1 [Ambystoma mexicanum]|uniref:endoplasmic reticulum metallopeptidase 1 n=1 Tax=Ambystoma mexicanum TaxID=8296 RepID=UPI0037E7420F